MANWQHRITDVNIEERTATCAIDGRVNVRKKSAARGRYTWRCIVAERKWGVTSIGKGFRAGRCKICEEESNRLVFDHNHITGKFRGWICSKCNTAIGLLGTIALLDKAKQYLQES